MHPSTDSPDWVRHLDRLHLLTPLRVALVLFVAIVATLFVRRFVAKALNQIFERTVPSERPRAEARHRALSSALRAALTGVIWAVAVITMISEVGINIGGFVATATVVGGAIAFGAQTLIRDIISGFFVLSDDQYGVGDEVDLGHATGVVERVTLRTARLRDGEGRVWYVAHGNVLRVANLSKASVAMLDIEVARSMDVGRITDVTKGLAAALVDDPLCAPLLLNSPVVVGIIDLSDDRIVFRVSAATHPGQRDAIRRAWRVLALNAFAVGDLIAPVPTTSIRFDALASSSGDGDAPNEIEGHEIERHEIDGHEIDGDDTSATPPA